MNDFEKQKLGMYEEVVTLLSENRDIVSNVRTFSSNAMKLRKVMDEIRRLDKTLSSEILDKTIQNESAKDDLINHLAPVISGLFNFSKQTDNIQLREKTRLSKSNLVRMLECDLLDKSEAIRLLALKYIVELKKLGITPNTLMTLSGKIGAFRMTLDSKVSSLVSSSTVMLLNDLFMKADGILNLMDQFVESLEDEYEEFYDEYIFARDIENQDQKKALMELEEEDGAEE